MKTLLIRLNHTGFPIPPPDMPLGLLYVASSLESAGFNVIVRDLCRVPIEPEVWEQIKTGEINFVGISFLSFVRSEGYRLAKKIKEINPSVFVVAGGIFPASMPAAIMGRYPFDAVVVGEGEKTMCELAQCILLGNGIAGVKGVYSAAHGWHGPAELIQDLDSIPFPAWHHTNLSWFKMTCAGLLPGVVINGVRLENAKWAPLIASRGCVGRCVFCNAFKHWGGKVRFRSAENILDEVEALYTNNGVRLLAFNDDAFPLRKSQCAEFCEGLIKRGLKIAWQTTTRGDTLDDELCELMAASGCFMVAIGVESGSQTIHDRLKKNLDLDKAAAAIQSVKKADMIAYTLMMIGNPGESEETINDTIKYLLATKPDWYSFVRGVLVVPGTELFNMAVERGQVNEEMWLCDATDGLPIYTVEHSKEQFDAWAERIEAEVPRCLLRKK